MAAYKLTVRRGPKVSRDNFEQLGDAIVALQQEAESVLAEGGLGDVKMFRTYEPGQRVAARLEISTGRMLRGTTAGIDVMGDGSLVAFKGGVARSELKTRGKDSPYDTVQKALRGKGK